MGTVFVVFNVYPEGPEEVEKVETAVKEVKLDEGVELKDIKKEPLAFGMSIIKAGFTFDDKAFDQMDTQIEAKLRDISGVQNVEVAMSTLL